MGGQPVDFCRHVSSIPVNTDEFDFDEVDSVVEILIRITVVCVCAMQHTNREGMAYRI